MRARRMLPGSLTPDGYVVDYQGRTSRSGPCFIPADIKPLRKAMMGMAGWCVCPPALWPSLPPSQGLGCIFRPAR